MVDIKASLAASGCTVAPWYVHSSCLHKMVYSLESDWSARICCHLAISWRPCWSWYGFYEDSVLMGKQFHRKKKVLPFIVLSISLVFGLELAWSCDADEQ